MLQRQVVFESSMIDCAIISLCVLAHDFKHMLVRALPVRFQGRRLSQWGSGSKPSPGSTDLLYCSARLRAAADYFEAPWYRGPVPLEGLYLPNCAL